MGYTFHIECHEAATARTDRIYLTATDDDGNAFDCIVEVTDWEPQQVHPGTPWGFEDVADDASALSSACAAEYAACAWIRSTFPGC